jgi:cysteate synthase
MRFAHVGAETTVGEGANARHYELVCSGCGRRQDDDGLTLDCPEDHVPALLRTEYANREFRPRAGRAGLFKYQDWLPLAAGQDGQEDVGGPAVYRSNGLAKALGLSDLWIAFNGYWPERGGTLLTGTFKEYEAYTVLGRLAGSGLILTIASSGNTGAAFAWACSQWRAPCLVIVPGRSLQRFGFRAPLDPCVKLVSIEDGDYPDAMELAAAVSTMPYFQAEGGVKNVGRRDGLATVLLAAFDEMRRLPTHYFQAVGSGTGAIAVLEAARRLLGPSVPGASGGATGTQTPLPRLMLCQNLPFTPIYDAWQTNGKTLVSNSPEHFRKAVRQVYADELTNWLPPYSITGGVYDALTASGGDVLVADNAAVRAALDMFTDLEGIDIEPAAAVALACLRDAVARGMVNAESTVLLNITGGGRLRFAKDHSLIPVTPQLRLSVDSIRTGATRHAIAALRGESR